MDIYAGVDCGATHIRVGLVDSQGVLIDSIISGSPLRKNPAILAEVALGHIQDLLSKQNISSVEGVGIGVPGPIDFDAGLLLSSANLDNAQSIDLRHQFEVQRYKNVYFDRDTNIALLGEKWQGEAVENNNVILLTIGTGVGGSILSDGEIVRGENGGAGELGHIYIDVPDIDGISGEDIPICGLDHKGCLEAYINSTHNITHIAYYLGYGLANIVDIFNPEKIIIGGGKLKMGDFLSGAIAVMQKTAMKPAVFNTKVCYAKLKDLSGVYGGAKLAILQQGGRLT